MKIRRFKWNPADQQGWRADRQYVEFSTNPQGSMAYSGGELVPEVWDLADAERLVRRGSWVEISTTIRQALGDWPEDFGHENGSYCVHCSMCGAGFTGHKRRVVCKVCWRANKKGESALGYVPEKKKEATDD